MRRSVLLNDSMENLENESKHCTVFFAIVFWDYLFTGEEREALGGLHFGSGEMRDDIARLYRFAPFEKPNFILKGIVEDKIK